MIGRALKKRLVVGILLAGLIAAAALGGDPTTAAAASVKAPRSTRWRSWSSSITSTIASEEEKCAKRLTLAAADSFEGIRVQGEMGWLTSLQPPSQARGTRCSWTLG